MMQRKPRIYLENSVISIYFQNDAPYLRDLTVQPIMPLKRNRVFVRFTSGFQDFTSDARAREKYLKSGMGKMYIKNRLRRFLSLTGLMEA